MSEDEKDTEQEAGKTKARETGSKPPGKLRRPGDISSIFKKRESMKTKDTLIKDSAISKVSFMYGYRDNRNANLWVHPFAYISMEQLE
jgi:hypothetical protein